MTVYSEAHQTVVMVPFQRDHVVVIMSEHSVKITMMTSVELNNFLGKEVLPYATELEGGNVANAALNDASQMLTDALDLFVNCHHEIQYGRSVR